MDAVTLQGGVSIVGLVLERSGRVVLEVPALEVAPGAQAAVIGPSGCGKTSLFAVLAGLLPIGIGRVVVAGEDLGSIARHGAHAVDRFRARGPVRRP